MKTINAVLTATCLCLCSTLAAAQGASKSTAGGMAGGKSSLGVSSAEMESLNSGWSAKRYLLGKNVVNDRNDKIGKVDDLILTQEKPGFAVIGTGGFVGMGKHDVAIPMDQLQINEDHLLLPGATKEALKALPEFEPRPKKK